MILERVALIEELAANALPAAVVQKLDGWWLRYNHGVTRRANSVLAGGHDKLSLEDKLEVVEAFYARRGARARFQLCGASQPEGLDICLERRGYSRYAAVHVQTAAVDEVVTRAQVDAAHDVAIYERPEARWLELYLTLDGADEHQAGVRCATFERIPTETAFVLLEMEGRPAAVGLGVLERGYVGVFNMATHPKFRRRGAAGTILHSLAGWGWQRGADGMYLQVAEENAVARSLYERPGFRTLYRYQYRETP